MDDSAIRGLSLVKVFNDNTQPINGLDFTEDGEFLVTSSDDESIRIYSMETGEQAQVLFSKKYGVDLIHCAHHPNLVVTASKNESDWDQTLRYLSLHDNKYLRYFRGHRAQVVSIAVHPQEDMFLSASLDETARFWDFREHRCMGLLRLAGRPTVAFDPDGLVFAVGMRDNTIKLYDLRTYSKGPFSTIRLVTPSPADWAGLEFSPNGENLLVSTMSGPMYLVDSFKGELVRELSGRKNDSGLAVRATFSPDGSYVASGCEDGSVGLWNSGSGALVRSLSGHPDPTLHVRFNRRLMVMASACQSLAMWSVL
eukprot:c534_g1_i1.p1 GENE.c534_g1_i1~~c534_g1_i1.p1  ORF type:complete len:311 (-),score=44.89 c534_g1_i1:67-999(-)